MCHVSRLSLMHTQTGLSWNRHKGSWSYLCLFCFSKFIFNCNYSPRNISQNSQQFPCNLINTCRRTVSSDKNSCRLTSPVSLLRWQMQLGVAGFLILIRQPLASHAALDLKGKSHPSVGGHRTPTPGTGHSVSWLRHLQQTRNPVVFKILLFFYAWTTRAMQGVDISQPRLATVLAGGPGRRQQPRGEPQQ